MKSSTESQQTDIIQKKTQAFKGRVLTEADPKYKDLFEDFIGWWTQPSKSGKQIRYDGEKYFGMNQRLATFRKRQPIEEQKVIQSGPGGKLDQMDISDLKSAYNTKDENGYVDIMYFDVFNFLVKKGVINPNNPKYYKQKYMEAGALIMARLIDQKKQLDTSGKMDIDRRLERIKEYNDHEIKPQAQCLVLRDLFKKYSLEQLLNKAQ